MFDVMTSNEFSERLDQEHGGTANPVWRAARIVGGGVLLAAGGILLIIPGPGIPFVIAGLLLLEKDLEWARRLRRWLVEQLAQPPRTASPV